MRTPLIAGNWKMNTAPSEAVALVKAMLPGLEPITNVEKVICPPFVSLVPVKQLLQGSSVRLGAQNVYFEPKGAYTGEVSPAMLAELCEYVIIGHSERRQYFHETGEIVFKKVQAALKVGLKPILCVGEKLEDNEAGRTAAVISEQLGTALTGIYQPNGFVIAYEPVWAIGTGKAATGSVANDFIGFIRRRLTELYGEEMAQSIRILYGGSVTAENTAEYMRQPEIDGALVGGASLKVDQFLGIVRQTVDIKGKV